MEPGEGAIWRLIYLSSPSFPIAAYFARQHRQTVQSISNRIALFGGI